MSPVQLRSRTLTRRGFERMLLLLVLSLWLVGSAAAQVQTSVSYIYDRLGRLIAVIDPSGDSAIYQYDSVGNLLSITRQTLVSIIDFEPRSGPAGTTVTIFGTAFSSTINQNTVAFNGVPVTVTSAAATQLVVQVRSGVTTGPISVTTPTGSAVSTRAFTVTTTALVAPTITSFTPTMGMPGTAVTITGTNFDPMPANDRVTFKALDALVNSANPTSLATSVPSGALSGPIAVATPYGQVVSTQDFFVLPPGVDAASIGFTGRIIVGGSSLTATIGTAGKVGLVIFDAVAGQRLNLAMLNVTIGSSTVSILKPDGTTFASTTVGTGGGFLDSPVLPVSGTYTILITPSSTYTGSMTLTLSAELTGAIAIGGSPVTATITRVGQNARYSFSGTAGQQVSLTLSNTTVTPSNGIIYGYLVKPDGSNVTSTYVYNGGSGFIDTQTLPTTGTYSILVDPYTTSIGSVTLGLADTQNLTGSITIDGAPVTVTTTVPGQNARYTFNGTAGQRINVGLTTVSMTSASVFLLKPDGTTFASVGLNTIGGSLDPPGPLPVSGTYTLLVDPSTTYTGSVTLTLSSEVAGAITVSGPAVTATTTRPGQNARYSFSGAAGQQVSLTITNATVTPSNGIIYVWLYKPDGNYLTYTYLYNGQSGFLDTQTLPTTGTYSILVDPYSIYTGSVTLTLGNTQNITGSITIDGPPVTVTTTVPGQNARYTFNGTAGQRINVGLTTVSMTFASVFLLKPDGSTFGSVGLNASGGSLDPPGALPVTGTYTLLVDPSTTYTGSVTLTLSSEVAGAITIGGAAVTATTTRPGQNVRYSFSGAAGQQVSLTITNATVTPSNGIIYVWLYKPDGNYLTYTYLYNGQSGFLDTQTLPTTGTYSILVDPSGIGTGSVTLTLGNTQDVTGSITIGGPAVTVTTTVPGQNVRYTFSGTAGQQVSLTLSNVSLTSPGYGYVYVLKPDGTTLAAVYVSTSGGVIKAPALPVTGTYTIFVDPQGLAIGTLTLVLTVGG